MPVGNVGPDDVVTAHRNASLAEYSETLDGGVEARSLERTPETAADLVAQPSTTR
jgi:hypothetical protein